MKTLREKRISYRQKIRLKRKSLLKRALSRRRAKLAHDFSDVETNPAGFREIQRLASEAGQAAASEAKAIGIPKIYAKNNQILREEPDGKIKVIVEANTENAFFLEIKASILHARKK